MDTHLITAPAVTGIAANANPAPAFATLGLSHQIQAALAAEGYCEPTPIQIKAIPAILTGRDLLGIAQTGTGKTAAFALPILQRLSAYGVRAAPRTCRALILSPTRELACQLADSFRTYGRNLNMRVAVVYGGVAHRPQSQALSRGVDVLVATPGRLLDHIGERNLSLHATEVFVLDEADQMLDLGFVQPIRRIVSGLPIKRQNLFFSATMPYEIGALAAELLRNPERIEVTPQATTVERIIQRVIHIEQSKKRALLVELLSDPSMSRTLIFTRTKRGADRVAEYLAKAEIEAIAIHGNKSQNQRQAALQAFRDGDVRVLVATDIAARGIDIDLVTHVINYELPEVPEAYVHRIGRTARAGSEGIAISLCDREERDELRAIERLTRQQILAEDRTNDATLTADANVERKRDRNARRNAGGNTQRDSRSRSEPRGRDRGRNARPGQDRGPRADAPRARPAAGGVTQTTQPTAERHSRSDRAPDRRNSETRDNTGGGKHNGAERSQNHSSRPNDSKTAAQTNANKGQWSPLDRASTGPEWETVESFENRGHRGRPDRDHTFRDQAPRAHAPRDGGAARNHAGNRDNAHRNGRGSDQRSDRRPDQRQDQRQDRHPNRASSDRGPEAREHQGKPHANGDRPRTPHTSAPHNSGGERTHSHRGPSNRPNNKGPVRFGSGGDHPRSRPNARQQSNKDAG